MARKEYRSLEYWKSDNDIVYILECFDKEKKAFVFGERIEWITRNDMSLLFGLPCVGEEIHFQNYKRIVGSGFTERRLADYKDLSQRVLEEQILRVWKQLDEKIDCICGQFGNDATQYLENSLLNMNSVESACGCLVGLLFWVCEHKKLIQPIEGREHISPKFVKWNLLSLCKIEMCSIHTLQEIKAKDETSARAEVATYSIDGMQSGRTFKQLKKEIAKLQKGKGKYESPQPRSMIVRMRARTRQPLVRPEYAYPDKLGKTHCKKMKVDQGYTCKAKPIGVRRLRVGKCLSLHEADIFKKYLDANNPMDAFWHRVRSAVYRKVHYNFCMRKQ
ncbi:unnamed protein product [Prunus armeniaca]|nr:unnamed protein product [Prunus armeniaca]